MLLEDVKKEFMFHCQCRKLSERTIINYSHEIGYLLDFLSSEYEITETEEVRTEHIKKFLVKMQKAGRSVNYINDLLKAAKVFFKYAYEEQYTEKLITEKIHNAKGAKVIIRTFTDSEVKRMISYYDGNDYLSIRNKTILLMLIDTGIRLSELTGMQERQIKSDYIIIKGKGNKERVVPKSPMLGKWMIKYMNVRGAYFQYKAIPEYVFLSKTGKPLGSATIDKVVKEAGANSDISFDVRVSAHTFRHTYAQYQLRQGMDIYTLSRLLRHESISITQTYLNGIRDKEILAQGRKTSPLMNL